MNKNTISKFISENKLFVLMILVTPGIVWTVTKPVQLIKEWSNLPVYINEKRQNIFSEDHIKYVEDLRWANISYTGNDFRSRIFYNKATVLVDEFFNYLTFLNPRLYFQSGDGSVFSPNGVEPVFGLSFIFFVLGIVYLIKNNRLNTFYLIFGFSMVAYLSGRRNLAFLLPIMILYIYISYLGIDKFIKRQNIAVFLYVIFSIYLLGRSLWLA